jgi:methylase of polypeptide subunit release factors
MYIDDKLNKLKDFAKQTDLSLQVLKQNKIVGEHSVVYAEQFYKIKQDVFSPAIFNGWRTFVPLLEEEESVCGDMLEIDCGSGIIGLHLLRINKIQSLTASDISAIAVENTRENAQILHLENLVTVV